jgi:murein DD-endopeptidase MepM/ murein hydrolase activator NlpD
MNTPMLLAAMVLALAPVMSGAAGPAPAVVVFVAGSSPAGSVAAGSVAAGSSPAGSVAAEALPAGAVATGTITAGPPGWSWPLSPKPGVLRAFDPPPKPWLSGHRGVDLASASFGTPVTAPSSGTVSFVGVVVDRPVITIDHGDGLRSSFEPVESELIKGAHVAEGGTLGNILPGHCGTLPCVHWGVRRGETYVNPLAFVMDLRPSILLPPLDPAPG